METEKELLDARNRIKMMVHSSGCISLKEFSSLFNVDPHKLNNFVRGRTCNLVQVFQRIDPSYSLEQTPFFIIKNSMTTEKKKNKKIKKINIFGFEIRISKTFSARVA